MSIHIVTAKGKYRLASVSLFTFVCCCLLLLALAALLVGSLSQELAHLGAFLVHSGAVLLQFALVLFATYRIALWLWRLVLRRAWIDSYVYRRELVLALQQHIRSVRMLLILLLFR